MSAAAKIEKGPRSNPVYTPAGIPDMVDPKTYAKGHPFEAYKRLREEAPVYFNDQPEPYEPGVWVLSRHADIMAVSKNPKLWSSANASHLLTTADPEMIDPRVVAAVLGNMVAMDPPEHVGYRRMVTPGFTPARVNALEDRIRARTKELVDNIAKKGSCDFLIDVAQELPVYTLAEILGVPQEDRPKMIEWANTLTGIHDPEFTRPVAEYFTVLTQLFDYGRNAMEERRKTPRDDLLSIVANAKVEGVELPPNALDGFFMIMLVGGNETTRNTIAGGLVALTKFPEQRQKLLNDPSLIPNAVEEMLRFVSPVVHFCRRATEDTEIRGQKIKAGEKVMMLYGAANYDEEIFPNADQFDVTRANARDHLSFGAGQHFCLGSRLGQLQIKCMFEEVLRRLPDIHITQEPSRLTSNFIIGIKNEPCAFTPEA